MNNDFEKNTGIDNENINPEVSDINKENNSAENEDFITPAEETAQEEIIEFAEAEESDFESKEETGQEIPVEYTDNNMSGNSGKGFKVFVGVLLAVFTMSAVSIAAFLALDYMSDLKTDTAIKTETNSTQTNNIQNPATFKDEEGAYTKTQVAAKCGPSAVGIVVEVETSSGGYYDFGFFGNYYSNPQVVQAAGSGFIYSADGYIITNHHVIENAQNITVYLNDKTELKAELVGSDSLSDIAVIKVNPEGVNLVPMEIGDSSELVVGDEVIAIGCPAGIEYMGTVTDGIISAINRDISLTDSGSTKTMTLLQTNATIN